MLAKAEGTAGEVTGQKQWPCYDLTDGNVPFHRSHPSKIYPTYTLYFSHLDYPPAAKAD
jgi:hypothetical protein